MANLTITAANVAPASDAGLDYGTSGATITAGMAVYLDSTTATYKIADTTTSATTAAVKGIALTTSSANQPITVQTSGGLDLGATLAIGEPYILSTAGLIAPASDLAQNDYTTLIGIATAADNIKLGITVGGVLRATA